MPQPMPRRDFLEYDFFANREEFAKTNIYYIEEDCPHADETFREIKERKERDKKNLK